MRKSTKATGSSRREQRRKETGRWERKKRRCPVTDHPSLRPWPRQLLFSESPPGWTPSPATAAALQAVASVHTGRPPLTRAPHFSPPPRVLTTSPASPASRLLRCPRGRATMAPVPLPSPSLSQRPQDTTWSSSHPWFGSPEKSSPIRGFSWLEAGPFPPLSAFTPLGSTTMGNTLRAPPGG